MKNKKINFKNMGKKQKIVVGVVSVLILAGGGIAFNTIRSEKIFEQKMQKLVDLYNISGKEKIFMTGKVYPSNSQDIFLEADQGKLDKLKVEDGQYIEKGKVLFTCKNEEQIKEISNLNKEIADKKKERQTLEDEESKKAIDIEIKELNNQIATLNKTAYQTVYAPFSGKVYIKSSQSQGEASSPILSIKSTDFYVKAQVNERDSYKIQTNQNVEVTTIANNKKYSGTISKIGDTPIEGEEAGEMQGNGMTLYGVNIALDNQENLKSGLNTQVIAFYGTDDIKVPNTAIVQDGDKNYVYKVNDSKVHKVAITVVEEKEDVTLIKGNLKENEQIVKDAIGKLFEDGDRIYTSQSEFDER